MNSAITDSERRTRDHAIVQERNSGMLVRELAVKYGVSTARIAQVLQLARARGDFVVRGRPGRRQSAA
jgi:Mor family transcriptional regulator